MKPKIYAMDDREVVRIRREEMVKSSWAFLNSLVDDLEDEDQKRRFRAAVAYLEFVYGGGPVNDLVDKLTIKMEEIYGDSAEYSDLEGYIHEKCDLLIEACNKVAESENCKE